MIQQLALKHPRCVWFSGEGLIQVKRDLRINWHVRPARCGGLCASERTAIHSEFDFAGGSITVSLPWLAVEVQLSSISILSICTCWISCPYSLHERYIIQPGHISFKKETKRSRSPFHQWPGDPYDVSIIAVKAQAIGGIHLSNCAQVLALVKLMIHLMRGRIRHHEMNTHAIYIYNYIHICV